MWLFKKKEKKEIKDYNYYLNLIEIKGSLIKNVPKKFLKKKLILTFLEKTHNISCVPKEMVTYNMIVTTFEDPFMFGLYIDKLFENIFNQRGYLNDSPEYLDDIDKFDNIPKKILTLKIFNKIILKKGITIKRISFVFDEKFNNIKKNFSYYCF
jgi:hypothetical protein